MQMNPAVASKIYGPKAELSFLGRRQHRSSQLAEAARDFGGVLGTARWQGRAEQLEKPSSSRREIGGAGKPYNWCTQEIGDRREGLGGAHSSEEAE
jgi:hypothetical protein